MDEQKRHCSQKREYGDTTEDVASVDSVLPTVHTEQQCRTFRALHSLGNNQGALSDGEKEPAISSMVIVSLQQGSREIWAF